jgi:hypothetical protein
MLPDSTLRKGKRQVNPLPVQILGGFIFPEAPHGFWPSYMAQLIKTNCE